MSLLWYMCQQYKSFFPSTSLQDAMNDLRCEGNMFLSKLCGAKIYIINLDLFQHGHNLVEAEFNPRKEKLAQQLRYVGMTPQSLKQAYLLRVGFQT